MSPQNPQFSDNAPVISAQKDNTERLIECIERLDKSTTFYSKRILYLTAIMMMVVIIQTFIAIETSNVNGWSKLALVALVAVSVLIFLKTASGDLKKD